MHPNSEGLISMATRVGFVFSNLDLLRFMHAREQRALPQAPGNARAAGASSASVSCMKAHEDGNK